MIKSWSITSFFSIVTRSLDLKLFAAVVFADTVGARARRRKQNKGKMTFLIAYIVGDGVPSSQRLVWLGYNKPVAEGD